MVLSTLKEEAHPAEEKDNEVSLESQEHREHQLLWCSIVAWYAVLQ